MRELGSNGLEGHAAWRAQKGYTWDILDLVGDDECLVSVKFFSFLFFCLGWIGNGKG